MHVVSLTEEVIFRLPHVGTLTKLLHPFLQWASFQGRARGDLSLETEVFRQKASPPFLNCGIKIKVLCADPTLVLFGFVGER